MVEIDEQWTEREHLGSLATLFYPSLRRLSKPDTVKENGAKRKGLPELCLGWYMV